MKFWPVLKWMFFIALAIAISAGVGCIWLWQNSDRLIRQQALRTFDLAAPDLTLQIEGIQLASTSSLRLTGLEIRDRKTNRPLLRAREAFATVDEAAMMERQNIIVRSIKVSGVELLLKRSEAGRWNWQDYKFHRISDNPLIPPSISLENVRAQIQLEHGAGIPPASLIVTSPSFQAVPKSAEVYDFSGSLSLPGAGDLGVSGTSNLTTKAWNLRGQSSGISADQSLMEIAKSTAPQLAAQLEQLDARIARILPALEGTRTASNSETSAIIVGSSGVSPRFMGVLDVNFIAEKRADAAVPELRLKVDVRDGQLSSPVIPVRLSDVRATFFWDNSNVIFKLLNARDGDASMTGEFAMKPGEDSPAPVASIHLEKFPVSKQLQPLFPEKTQRIFDHFQPSGTVSGDISIQRFPSGKWLPVSIDGVAEDASLLFHKFRYPVTGVSATFHQQPMESDAATMNSVVLDITANGMLGSRPVQGTGWIRNPGPEQELEFHVNVEDLPLDGRFRDALDAKGRKVIDSLNIDGVGSARVDCHRAPGLNQPTDIELFTTVRDTSLRFSKFPYKFTGLTGELSYESKARYWRFTNLHGWHDKGEFRAGGSFRGLPEPGELQLLITGENASLDSDLFNALNPSTKKLWTMLKPEGSVSLTTRIDWTSTPGHVPVVELQNVRIFDASIYPAPFPYRMNINEARLSYKPNDPGFAGVHHCTIETLKANHDGSPIVATDCWAKLTPDGFWQLHLNDLNATDLKPDDQLRAALPGNWRDTLSRLSQAGRISVESSELDFRGVTNGTAPATSAWSLNLRLKGCAGSAGLDLTKVSGMVVANGTWDGYHLQNEGQIRLDHAEILNMAISDIHGPYTMSEDELVLGCREIIKTTAKPADVALDRRILANAFRGRLEMDGIIDLKKGSEYEFFGELKNGLLEDYAARHLPDQRNMKGVVNAWLSVNGDGDSAAKLKGRGQVLISPAALYEVPIILEMLNALSTLQFAVPNRAAFNYALMSFNIQDKAFEFEPVDLSGDSLALRGRGRVGFGGDVKLDFYSRPPITNNPLKNIVVSGTTSLVTVQVRGTTSNPQTTRGSRKIDDSMREFFGAFEPRPGAPVPALNIPRMFGIQNGTQATQDYPGGSPR